MYAILLRLYIRESSINSYFHKYQQNKVLEYTSYNFEKLQFITNPDIFATKENLRYIKNEHDMFYIIIYLINAIGKRD